MLKGEENERIRLLLLQKGDDRACRKRVHGWTMDDRWTMDDDDRSKEEGLKLIQDPVNKDLKIFCKKVAATKAGVNQAKKRPSYKMSECGLSQ